MLPARSVESGSAPGCRYGLSPSAPTLHMRPWPPTRQDEQFRVDTLDRILRAAGYAADITTSGRPDATDADRDAKGRELLQVLDLAAQFPARHDSVITFPRFPTGARA